MNKLLFIYLTGNIAMADFQYFNKGLDYWGESKATAKEVVAKEQKKEAFPWDKYLDPGNKEFFKEGDYVPPEPFLELIRNPSDYNIKMWFQYQDKKNELSSRLEAKMKDYATKQKKPEIKTGVDTKNYVFRMYFDSKCPHCKKMFETLSDLRERGFFVEVRQIDSGQVSIPFPVVRATKDELTQKDIKSVPLLLIGDLKRKVVYRLSGYQSTENVLSAIKN